MNSLFIPEGYKSVPDVYRTQKAIAFIKRTFEDRLADALNLKRVSAPLFVTEASGLNDNLNGYERPVTFDIPAAGETAQVVHSLAKWKRQALRDYNFYVGYGLYTDMNAIRRDEDLDNVHSIYVDQWDWEKVITREERTLDYLKETVQKIVNVICATSTLLKVDFPEFAVDLKREVFAITSSELENMYPDLTPKERENAITKEHGTVLIMQIGGKLKSGAPHDGRAPDYDDWALDEESLARQLKERGCEDRRELPFHKMLLAGELPLSIGGGIGQSRLCMLMMGCAHIGEVQSSIWDDETVRVCEENGIPLL